MTRCTLRFFLLLVFALFWGGLTFYTGIAVRVAHRVLEDPMDGGLITQQVTRWLQWLGVATVVLMLLNAWDVRQRSTRFGNALAACTLALGIALAGLFHVHERLDATIDVRGHEIVDRDAFTANHRRYNQLTTVEWLASVLYLGTTVAAWRRCDARPTSAVGHKQPTADPDGD